MSEYLKQLIILDNKVEEKEDLKADDSLEIINKMSSLLKHLNNDELLYVLNNLVCIHQVIDVDAYFKKYKINKKKLKEENSYKEAFQRLSSFVERIQDASLSEYEYQYICKLCDVDNVSDYLLKNMDNNSIMELSKESDDWNYKLFLFSNFKS